MLRGRRASPQLRRGGRADLRGAVPGRNGRRPATVLARDETVVRGDPCGRDAQALSGLAFSTRGPYPSRYHGALFLSDFARRIWVLPGTTGGPTRTRIELFRTQVENPVDLVAGPGGDLYYLDFRGGTLRRLTYVGSGAH